MVRNQPIHTEPLNPRKRERHPAPSGTQDGPEALLDGFTRVSQADARTGIRPTIGGTPVWPPYHEDL